MVYVGLSDRPLRTAFGAADSVLEPAFLFFIRILYFFRKVTLLVVIKHILYNWDSDCQISRIS